VAGNLETLSRNLLETSKLLEASISGSQQAADFAEAIIGGLKSGGKILLAGNGGSAADAQHMAAEFVNYFNFPRPGLPAIALTTDTSVLTSVSNDTDFKFVYSRQIQALGRKGDIFWCYTTSGKSKNIIEAARVAKDMGIVVCAFTGAHTSDLDDLCDFVVSVPSNSTPRIQETHLVIGHSVAEIVEQHFFGENRA
jgi:D-sedoheptulose 7-phosphate isomerase